MEMQDYWNWKKQKIQFINSNYEDPELGIHIFKTFPFLGRNNVQTVLLELKQEKFSQHLLDKIDEDLKIPGIDFDWNDYSLRKLDLLNMKFDILFPYLYERMKIRKGLTEQEIIEWKENKINFLISLGNSRKYSENTVNEIFEKYYMSIPKVLEYLLGCSSFNDATKAEIRNDMLLYKNEKEPINTKNYNSIDLNTKFMVLYPYFLRLLKNCSKMVVSKLYKEGDFGYWWLIENGYSFKPNDVYEGNIDCSGVGLTSLKGAPGKVIGDFNCSNNNLESLKYAPKILIGSFNCSFNRLKDLKKLPTYIEKEFDCSNNFISSIMELKKIQFLKSINISYNKINSLKGLPLTELEKFNCSHNVLTSLGRLPKITINFDCSYNMISQLEKFINVIKGNYYCNNNNLISLNGSPKEVLGKFNCSNNNISHFGDRPKCKNVTNDDFKNNTREFHPEDQLICSSSCAPVAPPFPYVGPIPVAGGIYK